MASFRTQLTASLGQSRGPLKLLLVGALALALLLPMALVRDLIDERNARMVEVRSELGAQWGRPLGLRGPQGLQDGPTVHPRHHHVEHHQGGVVPADLLHRLDAVVSGVGLEPVGTERELQDRDHLGLVIHAQHARANGGGAIGSRAARPDLPRARVGRGVSVSSS